MLSTVADPFIGEVWTTGSVMSSADRWRQVPFDIVGNVNVYTARLALSLQPGCGSTWIASLKSEYLSWLSDAGCATSVQQPVQYVIITRMSNTSPMSNFLQASWFFSGQLKLYKLVASNNNIIYYIIIIILLLLYYNIILFYNIFLLFLINAKLMIHNICKHFMCAEHWRVYSLLYLQRETNKK